MKIFPTMIKTPTRERWQDFRVKMSSWHVRDSQQFLHYPSPFGQLCQRVEYLFQEHYN